VNVESIVRRDRAVAGVGLVALVLLAWLYLFRMAAEMREMDMAPTMPMPGGSTVGYFLMTIVMWAVMMVAMMIPSASPMMLTFAAINRRRATDGGATVPLATFVTGYLLVWSAFSLVAAVLQWTLQEAALMSAATLKATPFVGAVILMAAGVYQLTPLKYSCLARCRSPFHFIMTEWREGARGALVMGVRHGAFCVGCCWALMALLFVTGVMNLLWVIVIAAYVGLEKLLPSTRWLSRAAGVLLCVAGVWLALR